MRILVVRRRRRGLRGDRLAGACWLPVVWMQIRMRDMAREAAAREASLPPLYWTYFRRWTLLGFPAFFALIAAFYLMVAKPM